MAEQVHISHEFGPAYDRDSRILILGSFPSVKSREASFYYAHHKNRFWKVLAALFPEDAGVEHADSSPAATELYTMHAASNVHESWDDAAVNMHHASITADTGNTDQDALIRARKAFLCRHHIALWDVIDSCTVTGSSDASIHDVVPVDLAALLADSKIERIYTNGKTAERYFERYLAPVTGRTAVCLPSTSPANAAWSLERLTVAWRSALTPHLTRFDPAGNPFYADKDIADGYLAYVWPDEVPSQRESTGQEGLGCAESVSVIHALAAVPVIRFHALDALPGIRASFTTKLGGISTGALSTLNLGFTRGDSTAHLRENYRVAGQSVGADLPHIVMTDQVHGTVIRYAEQRMALGPDCTVKLTGVDGLWTDRPGLALSATFADCVPVYLADPVGKRIALVHSGWKGTAAEIALEAVRALSAAGSRPEDIICVIGPSIDGMHYEVTADLLTAFRARFPEEEMAVIFHRKNARHYTLDLWAAVYFSLRRAGVPIEHIHFSGISTYENADILWSHRRSGGIRGNMNGFLVLEE